MIDTKLFYDISTQDEQNSFTSGSNTTYKGSIGFINKNEQFGYLYTNGKQYGPSQENINQLSYNSIYKTLTTEENVHTFKSPRTNLFQYGNRHTCVRVILWGHEFKNVKSISIHTLAPGIGQYPLIYKNTTAELKLIIYECQGNNELYKKIAEADNFFTIANDGKCTWTFNDSPFSFDSSKTYSLNFQSSDSSVDMSLSRICILTSAIADVGISANNQNKIYIKSAVSDSDTSGGNNQQGYVPAIDIDYSPEITTEDIDNQEVITNNKLKEKLVSSNINEQIIEDSPTNIVSCYNNSNGVVDKSIIKAFVIKIENNCILNNIYLFTASNQSNNDTNTYNIPLYMLLIKRTNNELTNLDNTASIIAASVNIVQIRGAANNTWLQFNFNNQYVDSGQYQIVFSRSREIIEYLNICSANKIDSTTVDNYLVTPDGTKRLWVPPIKIEYQLAHKSNLSTELTKINTSITQLNVNKITSDDLSTYVNNNLIKHMINITYADLKAKITACTLVKGQTYRITDYVTTCANVAQAKSAGYQFDLIVTAINGNRLNPICNCLASSANNHFQYCNLSKWQVWYDVENNTSLYEWADTVNGKGVIYRMIDEYGNDCPYDFKNIQFIRVKNTSTSLDSTAGLYMYKNAINGTSVTEDYLTENSIDYKWMFTFHKSDDTDSSISQNNACSIYNNIIKQYKTGIQQALSNNVFYGLNIHSNTFGFESIYNTLYDHTYDNICGNNFSNNTINTYFINNICGNNCTTNKIGSYFMSNITGNYFCLNTIANAWQYNKFGNDCRYIIVYSATSANLCDYVQYCIFDSHNSGMYLGIKDGNTSSSSPLQNIYLHSNVNYNTRPTAENPFKIIWLTADILGAEYSIDIKANNSIELSV